MNTPVSWQELHDSEQIEVNSVNRSPLDTAPGLTPVEVYTGQVTPQLPRWQGWAIAAKEKLDQLTQAAA